MTKTACLIGAHTSAAGGVQNALTHGMEIDATTVQLFTSNQKQWRGKKFTQKDLDIWASTLKETGLEKIMSHASYLINLGSPRTEVRQKSKVAFKEEIERCVALNLAFLNFHPGAALDEDPKKCLDLIVSNLLDTKKILQGSNLRLLLETTAGQGSSVGHKFEQLSYIIKHVKKEIPIGVCIDTCHIFAAGYDIRDKKSWNHTLDEFDKIIGINHLYALHVNDSLKPFASKKDRHATLGHGEIGIECFKVMMKHPKLKNLPKYLETPGGLPNWVKEIKLLKSFM